MVFGTSLPSINKQKKTKTKKQERQTLSEFTHTDRTFWIRACITITKPEVLASLRLFYQLGAIIIVPNCSPISKDAFNLAPFVSKLGQLSFTGIRACTNLKVTSNSKSSDDACNPVSVFIQSRAIFSH